jgi:hypothetical protein
VIVDDVINRNREPVNGKLRLRTNERTDKVIPVYPQTKYK